MSHLHDHHPKKKSLDKKVYGQTPENKTHPYVISIASFDQSSAAHLTLVWVIVRVRSRIL